MHTCKTSTTTWVGRGLEGRTRKTAISPSVKSSSQRLIRESGGQSAENRALSKRAGGVAMPATSSNQAKAALFLRNTSSDTVPQVFLPRILLQDFFTKCLDGLWRPAEYCLEAYSYSVTKVSLLILALSSIPRLPSALLNKT